jgi:hypothetical protein
VSFIYLITAAAGASRAIGASADVAVISALALIVLYLVLALKHVYLESNVATLLKAAPLLLLTLAVNNFASRMAIRITLALV